METGTIIVLLIALAIIYIIGYFHGFSKREKEWKEDIKKARKDARSKSRATLGGQFSQQLAPFLPDFKHTPTECKFLGSPVDLLVFKGMNDGEIKEVVFVEIKSGKAKLSSIERDLKKIIDDKKVRWEEYRVPEEITRESG